MIKNRVVFTIKVLILIAMVLVAIRDQYCKDSYVQIVKPALQLGKKRKKRVRRHLEDSSSYRTINRRNGYSKNTACKYVKEISSQIKDSFQIAKNFKPKWNDILALDGTYLNIRNEFAKLAKKKKWTQEGGNIDERFLHKMMALLSIDYHTRDLPHYSLADNENKLDLVLFFE